MAHDDEHCNKMHEPMWRAINKLPLWAWILITVLGPVALGLGGWSLAQSCSLCERMRGVEVQQSATDYMLKEVHDDVKEIRKAVLK